MRKTRKSNIIISIIVIILIALITFFCLRFFAKKEEPISQIQDQKSDQNIQKSDKSTKEIINNESSDIKKEDGVEIKDENSPNNSENVTGSITRASKANNGKFRIVAMTDQALSEGECSLTFSNDSATLNSAAEIISRANNSTCTFDIDLAEITPGKWNILVEIATTQNRFGTIKDIVEIEE